MKVPSGALSTWAAEAFEQSAVYANRSEGLRIAGEEGLALVAESVSIMLKSFSNAARWAANKGG